MFGNGTSDEIPAHLFMQELAAKFILWCKQHGNSPDKNNLLWWLDNRSGAPNYLTAVELDGLLRIAKSLKDLV